MRTVRLFLVAALLLFVPVFGGGNVYAAYQQPAALAGNNCQPGFLRAFLDHPVVYSDIYQVLQTNLSELNAKLHLVTNQSTYESLVTLARTVATSISAANGRLVITLPDGTVVLDTSRADNTSDPKSNSYEHFIAKSINENHNSRVAILSAQQYPCGVGIESKFSTSTGNRESYVAIRLGDHLDSDGTVRGSKF